MIEDERAYTEDTGYLDNGDGSDAPKPEEKTMRVFTFYVLDDDVAETSTMADTGDDAKIVFEGPTLLLLKHWKDAPQEDWSDPDLALDPDLDEYPMGGAEQG